MSGASIFLLVIALCAGYCGLEAVSPRQDELVPEAWRNRGKDYRVGFGMIFLAVGYAYAAGRWL